MFRSLRALRKPVPYAILFSHNETLMNVFNTPSNKIAIVEETPGVPSRLFTYGELQRDIVSLADSLSVQLSGGEVPRTLKWLQTPRSPHIKSLFESDEKFIEAHALNRYSCDAIEDDGRYNVAILCPPSYEFVVALLAVWALNAMAVPMCHQHKFEGEMTHVLEHSGARAILGDGALMKHKLPGEFLELAATAGGQVKDITQRTFQVERVVNLTTWKGERTAAVQASSPVDVEILEAAPQRKVIRGADDVVERLELEKKLAAERLSTAQIKAIRDDFLARNKVPDDDANVFCFDDTKPSSLNHVFQQRFLREAAYTPTANDDCLMIYTSGTTAKPKGVVHSHASVNNQVNVLKNAWRWTSDDAILNVLPLHHVHGLVNILLCSLSSGARCVFTPFDNAARVARRLELGDLTLFMGVPTIYSKLIDAVGSMSPIEKSGWRKSVSQNIRLMCCGSAALPIPVLERFKELSGHTLLERYGMTEIGMALSQSYLPLSHRVPGTVGEPLPTVETKVRPLATDESSDLPAKETPVGARFDAIGHLSVRSLSLFDRYFKNPAATKKEAIVINGLHYFDTGDTVGVLHKSDRVPAELYTILGRTSVDIIKCRGYKLSALEIEAALLSRKGVVDEVAVLGVKHEVLGEEVTAIVSLTNEYREATHFSHGNTAAAVKELEAIAESELARYKQPTKYVFVDNIPRNAMGKVNKKDLKAKLGLQ